jgi:hypothetical protein
MPTFLGDGSKDGHLLFADPLTGKLEWKTGVVFGGTLAQRVFRQYCRL